MARKSADTAALEAVLPDALGDSELRGYLLRRVRELVDAVFDTACEMLDDGSTAERAAVMKSVLPLLIRAVKDDTDDQSAEEILEQTRNLIAEMGRGFGA